MIILCSQCRNRSSLLLVYFGMPPFSFPARNMSFGPFDTPGGASAKKKDRASVFVWGWGSQGQLGIGDSASRLAPVSVRFTAVVEQRLPSIYIV